MSRNTSTASALRTNYCEMLWLVLVVFFLTAGLALVAIPLIPAEGLKSRADAAAFDASVETFQARLAAIVQRARILGVTMLLLASSLYLGRRRVLAYLSGVVTSIPRFAQSIGDALSGLVKREARFHLCILLLVFAVGIAIRLRYLFLPVNTDEAQTFVNYASRPLYIAISLYKAPNNHVFNSLLVNVIYHLGGDEEWMLRLPALIAGILVIPASYVVIRSLYNKHAALLTAALAAPSANLVVYSVWARGYTLNCLIFLSILAVGRYAKTRNNPAAWLAFGGLSALGLFTIPTMLYGCAVASAWIALEIFVEPSGHSRSHLMLNLTVAMGIGAVMTLVLYSPLLVVSGPAAVTSNQYIVALPWSDLLTGLPHYCVELWTYWNRDFPSPISILLATGAVASLILHRRLAQERVPLAVAAATSIGPLLAIQRLLPPVKIWVFLIPIYLGLASSGVVYLLRPLQSRFRRLGRLALPSLALVASLGLSLDLAQGRSIEKLVETAALTEPGRVISLLRRELGPNDVVVATERLQQPVRFYLMKYQLLQQHWHEYRQPDAISRVLIIVHNPRQTLDNILAGQQERGFDIGKYRRPREIATYGNVTIYEMRRREP